MRSYNKKEEIDLALNDLRCLEDTEDINFYALNSNIEFFKSLKNIFTFTKWYFLKGIKLDSSKLLEINDFPVAHKYKWDLNVYKSLVSLGRKKMLSFYDPLVKKIVKIVEGVSGDIFLASIGFGAMEVDRRVIRSFLENKSSSHLVIVGFDVSDAAREAAKENLEEFGGQVSIVEKNDVDKDIVNNLRDECSSRVLVVLSKNDIFKLEEKFTTNYFLASYHSLFKHHLRVDLRNKIDDILKNISKKRLEFDGVNSKVMFFPHTIESWKNPIFLNATIFSDLRYNKKQEIKTLYKNDKVSFSKIGTYLREY